MYSPALVARLCLALRSGGKYTAEQIEEQLRLSGVKGTDIQAGQIVATKDGIYDTSAKWLDLGNGQYVQQLAKLDLELVAYIQSSNSNYTWAAFPVAPDYDWSKTPNVSDEVRDRLSGRVLDAQGGFRASVLVDGEAFTPRFNPCGVAECVASGTGLDLKDPETQRWISAGNAKAVKDALAVGALVPLPMAWIGKVLGSVFGREVAGEALVGGSLGAVTKGGNAAPNFYTRASGETVPSTGYRYVSSDAPYLQELLSSGTIPANGRGTYISFDNLGSGAAGKLQVPHDAAIKIEFDTKQILDDVKIPNGQWGKADHLEPITTDFPQFGPGGATQAVTTKPILVNKVIDTNTGKVLYDRGK